MGVGQIISMSCLASWEQILEKESSRALSLTSRTQIGVSGGLVSP